MIRRAHSSDARRLAEMRTLLWPDRSLEEHLREVEQVLGSGLNGTMPMVILVAEEPAGRLCGFLEAGLRSHADDCDPAWIDHEESQRAHLALGFEVVDWCVTTVSQSGGRRSAQW